MIEINYCGKNTVKIIHNKQAIIINPDKLKSTKPAELEKSIQLLTNSELESELSNFLLTIDSPGEYEINNFLIKGVPATEVVDEVVYSVKIGDYNIAIVGDVSELTDEQLEKIDTVDILIIFNKESAKKTIKLIGQMSPKLVIPINFESEEVMAEISKEIGAPQDKIDRLIIKRPTDLPEKIKILMLQPKI